MNKMNQLLNNLSYLIEKGKVELPEENLKAVLSQEKQLTVDELLLIAELAEVSVSRLLERPLDKKTAGIKMLIMDCDGVLTDGKMIFTKNGDEIKHFNAKDGLGIKHAMKEGLRTGIISAGISTGLVEKRAEMLGIEKIYVGKESKLKILEGWLEELSLKPSEVVYIGDDLSDLPVLKAVGLAACPADAVREVRANADIMLTRNGGEGCVRELIEEHLL